MSQDHIDQAQQFLDSLRKLGEQLKAAENQQKFFISRMLELKREGNTDGAEYADLDSKSKSLQAIIDKYRPIYLERMEMVRTVSIKKRKREKPI